MKSLKVLQERYNTMQHHFEERINELEANREAPLGSNHRPYARVKVRVLCGATFFLVFFFFFSTQQKAGLCGVVPVEMGR